MCAATVNCYRRHRGKVNDLVTMAEPQIPDPENEIG